MSEPRDPWLDRIVIGTLSLMSLMGGASMTALAVMGDPYPPALAGWVGGCVGVLVGWFGHHRACSAQRPPQ